MSLGFPALFRDSANYVNGHEGIRADQGLFDEYYCSLSLELAREEMLSCREAVDNGLKSYSK